MILTKKDNNKSRPKEMQLQLYSLLGEGYEAMKEGREISIETLKERINQRRKENE